MYVKPSTAFPFSLVLGFEDLGCLALGSPHWEETHLLLDLSLCTQRDREEYGEEIGRVCWGALLGAPHDPGDAGAELHPGRG